jgi:hypothetical protein
MTKFKAMTIDEHVETTEQTTQESLEVRDKNKLLKAIEA